MGLNLSQDDIESMSVIEGFNIYQRRASKTRTEFDGNEDLEIARFALGASDEAGEVSGAVKKYLRGDFGKQELIDRISGEVGDVLWYLSQLCDVLGIDFGFAAHDNFKKLMSRKERGQIKGDGDER